MIAKLSMILKNGNAFWKQMNANTSTTNRKGNAFWSKLNAQMERMQSQRRKYAKNVKKTNFLYSQKQDVFLWKIALLEPLQIF